MYACNNSIIVTLSYGAVHNKRHTIYYNTYINILINRRLIHRTSYSREPIESFLIAHEFFYLDSFTQYGRTTCVHTFVCPCSCLALGNIREHRENSGRWSL